MGQLERKYPWLNNYRIQINKQKSQRNKLIDLLSQDISTAIENYDLITSPKLDRILDKIHQKWNYELHKEEFVKNMVISEKNLVGNKKLFSICKG
ncbi:hypothetical protein ABET51_13755 [Metabacillus fastidiosus]|uniref:hypothetical protein n=1 Tax=Metabacillus fastidiosus TaxID=1458 RepID=UPI003D2E674B